MFYKIYYIHINNINDIQNFLNKLHSLGYSESYLSDFSFCPYIIIHKDFEHNKIPVYENINKGYLDCMKSKVILVECNNTDELISHAYELTKDINTNNTGLF